MSSTEINYLTSPSASATSPSPHVVGPKVKGKSRASKAEVPLTLCGDADDLLDWSWQLPEDDEEEQHNAAMVEVDNSLLALYDAVYGPLPNASTNECYDDAAVPSHSASHSSEGASPISRLKLSSSEDDSNANDSSDTDEESFTSIQESSDEDYDRWDFFNQEPIPLLRRTLLDIVEDCAGQLLPDPEISNPSLIDKDDVDRELRYYEQSPDHEEDDEPNDEDEGDSTASSVDASPASSCCELQGTQLSPIGGPQSEEYNEGDTPPLTDRESIGDTPDVVAPVTPDDHEVKYDNKGKQRAGPAARIDESNFTRRSTRKRKFVEIQYCDEDNDDDDDDGDLEEDESEEEEKKPAPKSGRKKKEGPGDKLSARYMIHLFNLVHKYPEDETWECPCPQWMRLQGDACNKRYHAKPLLKHLSRHGTEYAAEHSGSAPPCPSTGCQWKGKAAGFGRHVHQNHIKAATVDCPCGGSACRDDHEQVLRHLRSASHRSRLKRRKLTRYPDVDDPSLPAKEMRWRQDEGLPLVEKMKGQRARKIARTDESFI